MRAFAAQARFLDAAERRHFGGDQAGVDADHAGLQRFRDPPDPTEIAREEVGGQTKRRGVAHRDHLGLVPEAEHRRQRPEGLLARHQRVGATSDSTVGSKKVPPSAWRLPPVTILAPCLTASAMCFSTLSIASMLISGPWVTPASVPSPIFIAATFFDSFSTNAS